VRVNGPEFIPRQLTRLHETSETRQDVGRDVSEVSWSLVKSRRAAWNNLKPCLATCASRLLSSFLDAERLGRDTTRRDWLWLKPKVKMFCNQISREASQSLPRSLWVVLSLHSVCTHSTIVSLPFGKRKKVDWTWRPLSITYSTDTDELGMRLKLGLSGFYLFSAKPASVYL